MKKSNTVVKRIFLIVCLCSLTAALQATIRYVKPIASGSGDGSSWANASGDLTAMIFASVSGDEIWVAAGTYMPTRDIHNNSNPANPRSKTFYLTNDIKLYGGFNGTETSPDQRTINARETVLSGDIGIAGNATDNCYHVVVTYCNTGSVLIDGVSIRHGNANGSHSVTFVLGLSSASATQNTGGGIFAIRNLILNNSFVSDNSAQALGGGIDHVSGVATISNTIFLANIAGSNGGALHGSSSNNVIVNSLFFNNASVNGAAIYLSAGDDNIVCNNTLAENNASDKAGGIYIHANSNSVYKISNNIFWNNKKGGNTSVTSADYHRDFGLPECTVFKNNLLQLTAASYTYTGTGINDLGSTASGNIFNTDPLFLNGVNPSGTDGIYRTPDDGLMLQTGSPCINTGAISLLPPEFSTDITGSPRIQANNVEMGAYETFICNGGFPRIYVNAASTTLPSNILAGQSWAKAFTSLSDALEIARTCSYVNEIWVAAGTYKPAMAYPGNSNPGDAREKTFYIPANVKIYGGFSGTETSLNQRNYINNETILSGDIGALNNNSDNCYHVVSASSSNAAIDGFTIRDGNANGSGTALIGPNNIPRNTGGGIILYQGTNTVTNNIITANNANAGGGIKTTGGTNTITGNFIAANSAGQRGGGINTESASDQVTNNVIYNNTSGIAGGGLYMFQSGITVNLNTFYSNAATGNGGGVFALDGSGQFSNNIFWKNTKAGSATAQGADYFRNSFDPNNNVFRNNLLQLTSGNYSTSGSGSYDLGNMASGNLFATDPLFILPANIPGPDGKLRTPDDGLIPDACSPVINTGNNSLVPSGLTSDILNNARIQLTTVDMGACEAISNSANQSAGLTTANLSITKSQNASTAYTNDCSTLIALVTSTGASPVSGTTTARVWIESTPPASFVKRHYEITPAANAATATGRVTLYFTQQDFTDFNATNVIKLPVDAADAANHKANLRIEKRSGTSNNGTGLPGSYTGSITVIDPVDADIVWNNASGRWEVSFDVSGFSGFFVKTTSGILPVTWISFNGTLNTNKQAVLNWKLEEQNVIHYQVEKSTDGASFANAGNLNSLGDGHHSYTFTDATPLSGRAFYRIRQTDRDGRFSYSAVIMLKNENRGVLSVFPNPFTSHIQVHSSIAQTILLYDLSGRTIRTIAVHPGTTSVNLATLAKGTYLLKSAEGDRIKLVKNE